MVGGTKFDEAKKVLENMGKNVIHCGPVGTGQVCVFHCLIPVKCLIRHFHRSFQRQCMFATGTDN